MNWHLPSCARMIILFHGTLVHNGAPCKREKEINFLNCSADFRFNAYVVRTGFVCDESKNSSNRRSGRKQFLAKHMNHITDASGSMWIKHCIDEKVILMKTER